jgi:hypothetical protein
VLFQLRGQQGGLLFGLELLRGQRFDLAGGLFLAREPLGGLFLELEQALLDAIYKL